MFCALHLVKQLYANVKDVSEITKNQPRNYHGNLESIGRY